MGASIDKNKFFVEFGNGDGVMIGTSYLDKEGTVLLSFFDSGDIQDGEGQVVTEEIFNKAKGFMTFDDIQQIANFMEVLKKASKPLIGNTIDKMIREDSNAS